MSPTSRERPDSGFPEAPENPDRFELRAAELLGSVLNLVPIESEQLTSRPASVCCSRSRGRILELLEGGRTGGAIVGEVDSAAQPEWGVVIGEWICAVDEHRG